jgi:glycolate oxidase FAD binding subunit
MSMGDNTYVTEMRSPADPAAVADAVRDADGKGLAVYPVGGGTSLDYGARPTRPGVGLSLANLSRVIDYPAADMTITVEAGLTISALAKRLADERQRLPIDVAQPDRATIGGAIAVNASGPRRFAYGTLRDYVLGLTAVDGAGRVFSGGGRVVKNAAGYNVCRMMVGSLGTLGVVTQVTLMVRPMVEASAFLVCEVPDFAVAEELLAGLISSPTRPAAVELLAGRQADGDLLLGPMLEGNVGRLHVGFEGSTAEVDWMVERLRAEWAGCGAAAPMSVPTSRAEPLWRWLTEFRADLEIHLLPSALVGVVTELLEMDPGCAIHAHAGDGVIRVKCPRPLEEDGVARLRAIASVAGGKTTVLKRPEGAAWSAAAILDIPNAELGVSRAIKDRFDPKNTLNPGRFVFD